MKTFAIITFFMLSSIYVDWFDYFKADYFISETGSDSNSGLTPWAPWQTLTQVNSTTFEAGDRIAFKRGNSFEGTLTVGQSGTENNHIIFTSYGTGEEPKIYGSKVLTGWTLHKAGSNIYRMKYSTVDITQLFLDGIKLKVARYPNDGYHLITSVISTSQIAASSMTNQTDNYYQNAKVLVRPLAFSTDIRTVTASEGDTITFNSSVTDIETTEGIVLINKFEFLDEAGEWYYNTTTDSVYVWTPAGDTPANYEMRGSTVSKGIDITNKNYVTIRGLNVLQQKDNGIYISGVCRDVNILNNVISGQEKYGISGELTATGGVRLVYNDNTISDCNAGGIYVYRNDTSTISGNTISDIGLFDRLGILGTSIYDRGFGMYINGRGNEITYNRLDSIGSCGIYWNSYEDVENNIQYFGASTISYNYITNSGLLKSDVGGIYTGGVSAIGSVVSYNIIDNCYGTKLGSKDSRDFGQGIYIDEPATTITVEYNTLINNSDGGINLHDGTNHIVRYNTMFNNRQSYIINDTVNSSVSTLTYNLCITGDRLDTPLYDPRQLEVSYYNDYNMDVFNFNTYVNVYTSDLVFKIVSPFSYSAFAAWQTYTANEVGSTYVGTDLGVAETQKVFINPTKTAKTFYLNGAVVRDQSGAVTSSFTIQPFRSRYIVGTDVENISETLNED